MASTRKRAPAHRSTAGRAASRRARPRRGRRGGLRSLLPRALPRAPVLDQRQRDVLGLALLAAGIFSGFVLYGSGGPSATGGRGGDALAVALGRVGVLVRPAILSGGGALLLRRCCRRCAPVRRCACISRPSPSLGRRDARASRAARPVRAEPGPRRTCRVTAVWAGEGLYQLAIAWSQTSASTSSSCSCCSPA